jgi:hypothetical protein
MKQLGGTVGSAIAGKSKVRPAMPSKARIVATGARKKVYMTPLRQGRSIAGSYY